MAAPAHSTIGISPTDEKGVRTPLPRDADLEKTPVEYATPTDGTVYEVSQEPSDPLLVCPSLSHE